MLYIECRPLVAALERRAHAAAAVRVLRPGAKQDCMWIVSDLTTDNAGVWQLHPSGERMRRQPSDASSQHSRSRSRGSDARSSTSSGKSGVSGSSSGQRSSSSRDGELPDGLADGHVGNATAGGVAAEHTMHLFAFPAESNFSGARFNPALVAAVGGGCAAALEAEPPKESPHESPEQGSAGGTSDAAVAPPSSEAEGAGSAAEPPCGEAAGQTSGGRPGRWLVAMDAAKACGSSPPDLDSYPAHFVVRLWHIYPTKPK